MSHVFITAKSSGVAAAVNRYNGYVMKNVSQSARDNKGGEGMTRGVRGRRGFLKVNVAAIVNLIVYKESG